MLACGSEWLSLVVVLAHGQEWVSMLGRIDVDWSESFLLVGQSGFRHWGVLAWWASAYRRGGFQFRVTGFLGCVFVLWWLCFCVGGGCVGRGRGRLCWWWLLVVVFFLRCS